MGDERGSANENENLTASDGEPLPSVTLPKPAVQLPRAVSLPPRPNGPPLARPLGTPPPPPLRNLPPAQPNQQPPPPLRATASPPPLPPSMRPPAPSARPPAPSMRPPGSIPAMSKAAAGSSIRPDGGRVQELLAELMSTRKELTEASTELRKVISERNALRIRLAQAENSVRELSSASRAEAQLRSEFVDAHAASSAALRARVSELEAALVAASRTPSAEERLSLRQIRGIGPAFERSLLGLGITTVAQIAALSADEIEHIAPRIKARVDRILRDDWVGQAKRLLSE